MEWRTDDDACLSDMSKFYIKFFLISCLSPSKPMYSKVLKVREDSYYVPKHLVSTGNQGVTPLSTMYSRMQFLINW